MSWSKILIRTAIGATTILLGTVGFGIYLMYPAFETPSPPQFPAPASRTEEHRQDLAYLSQTLHQMDRSFSVGEWRTFDLRIDELAARAESLDAAAFEMGIANAVAAGGNGHTNVLGALRGLTLNSIPLRFYWFAEGLHVVKVDPAYVDLLGAKVLRFGGVTPAELVNASVSYVGGSASLARELAVYAMESPQTLHAMRLIGSSSSAVLTLETLDGQFVERKIMALPVPANGPPENTARSSTFDRRELRWPRRELSPVPLPGQADYPEPIGDGREWAHVLDHRNVAFTLQNPNRFYWAAYPAGEKILFVQINALIDQPGQPPLEAFLDTTLAEAAGNEPQSAIIDLRSNPGGSYLHAVEFTRRLPEVLAQGGKIFILTSGNTFSAGLITAARLKYFAGSRSEIVGEPMGDAPQFWAEGATRITLPNSGLRIGYATGYHDWQSGCSMSQIFVCHLPNQWLGVAAGDLTPTMPVAWSFADFLEGKDTALETIMQRLGANLPEQTARIRENAPHTSVLASEQTLRLRTQHPNARVPCRTDNVLLSPH